MASRDGAYTLPSLTPRAMRLGRRPAARPFLVLPLLGGVERPRTATLARPALLDAALRHALDMSLLRAEALPGALAKAKRELSDSDTPTGSKLSKLHHSDANNNATTPTPRPRVRARPITTSTLPAPCTTCGRADAPERFHSHPATPAARARPVPPPAKTGVQKPVAIRYKPPAANMRPHTLLCYVCGREFGTRSLPLHEPKCLQKWERENAALPRSLQRPLPVKPDHALSPEQWNQRAWEASQASLAPCDNCGRTFLPDRLVVHLRSCKPDQHHRPPPNNPSPAQQHRPPPSNPSPAQQHRPLPSNPSPGQQHRPPTNNPSPGPQHRPTPNNSIPRGGVNQGGMGEPAGTMECYICGRRFGSRSIAIHEPQCLRKWRVQNDKLPPAQRRPEPVKGSDSADTNTAPPTTVTAAPPRPTAARTSSAARKPTLPCYICGREFGSTSLYIHEPQCLRKWRVENDKLPPAQRRPEPRRPDIKFTPTGNKRASAGQETVPNEPEPEVCQRVVVQDADAMRFQDVHVEPDAVGSGYTIRIVLDWEQESCCCCSPTQCSNLAENYQEGWLKVYNVKNPKV